jgi:DNA-binding CsgD family transcriptional regulator
MLIDLPKLEKALNGFDDAAVTPSKWQETMEDICKASGATSAVIVPVERRTPKMISTSNMEPVLETYFRDGWNERDFRIRGIPHLLKKGTMVEQDYATEEDFKKEGYYKFLAKYDLRWTVMVGFQSAPDESSCFVLYRRIGEGAFDAQEETLLKRMQNRLTMSGKMMRHLSANRVSGMAEAFDKTDLACVFFDRFCRVTKINAAAERLIGNGIDISRGEIRCWKQSDADALKNRVRSAVNSSLLLGEHAGDALIIARDVGRPLVVGVQRLSGVTADIFSHSVALAIISDPEARPAYPLDRVMKVFGLSKSEAIIALDLAAGDDLREISQKHDWAYSTVRSYMRSILAKTGTNRQSDLVSLLASLRGI